MCEVLIYQVVFHVFTIRHPEHVYMGHTHTEKKFMLIFLKFSFRRSLLSGCLLACSISTLRFTEALSSCVNNHNNNACNNYFHLKMLFYSSSIPNAAFFWRMSQPPVHLFKSRNLVNQILDSKLYFQEKINIYLQIKPNIWNVALWFHKSIYL